MKKLGSPVITESDTVPPSITEILYAHILKSFYNTLINKYDTLETH